MVAAFLMPVAAAALEAPAAITESAVWRKSDSPVNVSGVATIQRGGSLTIEPGVVVLFASDAGLIVYGELIARGAPGDSILFLPASESRPGAWGGVFLRNSDSNPSYDQTGSYAGRGTILEYCVIEGAGNPDVENGAALGFRASAPLVSKCSIRNSMGVTGVIRCLNSAEPMVIGCRIEGNVANRGGAIASSLGSRLILRNNIIVGNEASDHGGAIYVSLADAVIEGNLFSGNRAAADGGAIYAARVSSLWLTNNTFSANRQKAGSGVIFITDRVDASMKDNSFDGDGQFICFQKAQLPMSASGGWWGEAPNLANVGDAVRDRNDDRSEPAVEIKGNRWAPPEETPGTPAKVNRIILCRNDDFEEELPRGVAEGAPLRIRLDGVDVNPVFPDQIPVRVVSSLDPTGVVIPLQETGPSTGIYTGRGLVMTRSDQSRYTIGDLVGGEVTIYNPAHPEVKAVYKTLTPKPVVSEFTIADAKDISHITLHNPRFSWSYFEVVDRPQKSYKIEVADANGRKVWSSGELSGKALEIEYAGSSLEDGASYEAVVSVYSGKFWSDPATLGFRLNSLPSIPELRAPQEREIVATRTPRLAAAAANDREGDPLTYCAEVIAASGEPFKSVEKLSASGAEVAWVPPPLEENAYYTFRFKAVDPFEAGEWSDPRSFSVNSLEEAPAAFALVSPASGNVFDLNPTLVWETAIDPDPSSSVVYSVEIAKGGVLTGGRVYSGIPSTEFRIPDSLANRAEYSWRVTATDNTGRKTVSPSVGKFFVETTPSTPQLAAPLGDRDERKPEASLSWNPSTDPNPSDVITYEIEVFQPGFDGKPLASRVGWAAADIPVSSLSSWEGLMDNKVYGWRVRARDNHNALSDFSKPGTFFFNKINDAPTPPTAVGAPGDTVKGTTSVTFRWQSGADADLSDPQATLAYEVEAAVGGFESGDVRRFRSEQGAIVMTGGLDDNRLWTYRIRTVDDDGAVSGWFAARKTLVNVQEDSPAPFALMQPHNGAAIAELDSLQFSWNASSDPDWASSIRYRFELFAADEKLFKFETAQTNYVFKGGLENESSYRWRVTAFDNTGLETACDNEYSFSTNTTPTSPGSPMLQAELLPTGRIPFGPASDPNPRDRLTYTVELSAVETFAAIAASKSGLAHNPMEISIGINEFAGWDKLSDDQDYYVRIRAVDNHGYSGGYTSPAKFRYNKENDIPSVPAAPYSPAGGETVAERSPLLRWTASTDQDLSDPPASLTYEVRLDSDGEIAKNAMFEFTTPAGSVEYRVPVQLADNTPWVWAVRAKDDGGAASGWSAAQSFLLNQQEDPPSSPTLVRPYNSQQFNILGPISFGWARSIDPDYKSSVKYRLSYGKSADLGDAVSVEVGADSSYRVAGPLDNASYFWRVVAVDNTGRETPSMTFSMTLDTRPSIPQPAAPAGGVELKPDGRFVWSASIDPNPAHQVIYILQIAAEAGFGDVRAENKSLKETAVVFAAFPGKGKLADNQRYFWRIKAGDPQGISSDWSSPAEFVYNEKNDPPSNFSMTSPVSGDSIEPGAVTFHWEAAADPDPNSRVSYTLVIARDAQFRDGVQRFSGLAATEMTLPAGSFAPGSTGFWKVSAEDGMGGASFGSGSDRTPFRFSIKSPPPPPPPAPTTPTPAGGQGG